jgi:hypothetical protein
MSKVSTVLGFASWAVRGRTKQLKRKRSARVFMAKITSYPQKIFCIETASSELFVPALLMAGK